MSALNGTSLLDFESHDCDKPTGEGTNTCAPFQKGNIGQLKTLKQHAQCSSQLDNTTKDWHTVKQEDHDDFKFGENNNDDAPSVCPSTTDHTSPGTGTSGGGATTSVPANKACDFWHGIKRDPALFPKLKRDKDFHPWDDSTQLIAAT